MIGMRKTHNPGWFTVFTKRNRAALRFRWWNGEREQLVYLGLLTEPDLPTAKLESLVAKIQRMDYQKEDEQQRAKHLEMLLRLREVDKSWEGLN